MTWSLTDILKPNYTPSLNNIGFAPNENVWGEKKGQIGAGHRAGSAFATPPSLLMQLETYTIYNITQYKKEGGEMRLMERMGVLVGQGYGRHLY